MVIRLEMHFLKRTVYRRPKNLPENMSKFVFLHLNVLIGHVKYNIKRNCHSKTYGLLRTIVNIYIFLIYQAVKEFFFYSR